MPVARDEDAKDSVRQKPMTHRILVVEDEADLLDAVTFTLKKEGLKPIRAESGEEALELIDEARPDLVLLDLMLPGIDGIEVCRRLRANEKTSRVPIIMVTAKAEETDAIIGLGVGADDYVRKPFGLKELVARVRAVLRRAEEPQERRPPRHHLRCPRGRPLQARGADLRPAGDAHRHRVSAPLPPGPQPGARLHARPVARSGGGTRRDRGGTQHRRSRFRAAA